MKRKYNSVDVLPEGALSVKNYAEKEKISVAWVYKGFSTGKAKYDIIQHQGYNFVVNKTINTPVA